MIIIQKFNERFKRKNKRKYYTIGWYYQKEINIAKRGHLIKIGKSDYPKGKYEGGSVFLNIKDIEKFCIKNNASNLKNLSIFELIDCKKNDIYKKYNNHYLLNSKNIKYIGKYLDYFDDFSNENLIIKKFNEQVDYISYKGEIIKKQSYIKHDTNS